MRVATCLRLMSTRLVGGCIQTLPNFSSQYGVVDFIHKTAAWFTPDRHPSCFSVAQRDNISCVLLSENSNIYVSSALFRGGALCMTNQCQRGQWFNSSNKNTNVHNTCFPRYWCQALDKAKCEHVSVNEHITEGGNYSKSSEIVLDWRDFWPQWTWVRKRVASPQPRHMSSG